MRFRFFLFIFSFSITTSCAQKSLQVAQTAAVPQPSSSDGASIQPAEGVLQNEMKPQKRRKAAKAKRVEKAVQREPAKSIDLEPPQTPTTPEVKPEAEEANPALTGFFMRHFHFFLGICSIALCYAFLAMRRRQG